MADCIAPGWGTGAFGTEPWGGGLGAIPGGNIPVVLPFDAYCVGPCGPMSVILTYAQVSAVGDGTQFFVDPTSLDQIIASGGSASTTDARLTITTSVNSLYTLDFTVKFDALPIDFSSLTNQHVAVSITDAAGPCVTLFFSKTGIAYAGGFHHDGGGNLVLDSTFQQLPNSETVISEGEYWSYRIAADISTGVAYIYVTKTADLITIGHQLRYVMPVIPAEALAFPPTDKTIISVRGTVGSPSQIALDSICLSSNLIIPNSAPVADAGLDQAARTCTIVQLDGSLSFDPEGVNLTYKWRLLDAPLGSIFMFDGVDGRTFDTVSNFTNKFYSASLAVLDGADPISVDPNEGDVLVVEGEPYDIIAKGTDGSGFFVQVDGFVIPDNFLNKAFKLIRQRGISGPTTVNPTFFPDLAGLYKFDLKVFDGALFSEASVTVVNVTESPVPRGCIPDTRFLWNYLSDFWRLVEDKERIETFWSASAQVAASELLALWQIDYSKSLRDVQRTFQRRWLNYELEVVEPFPELTTIRPVFAGIRQVFPTAGIAGIPTKTLSFTIPFFDDLGQTFKSITHTFTGGGNLTATQVQDQLSPVLQQLDRRFTLTVTSNKAGTQHELRINAPFHFKTSSTDTAPIFTSPRDNTEPSGTGAGVSGKTYKVDRTLSGLDIKEGDILVVGASTFRVRGVTDDASDEWPDQRITLLDELPASPDTTWQLPGKVTSKVTDFYNSHVDTKDLTLFEIFDRSTHAIATLQLQGAWAVENNARSLGVNGIGALMNFLNHPTRKYAVAFKSATRLSHIPIDDLIVDIPFLQEKIKSTDDTAVLRRNIDFYIETFRGQKSVRFVFEGFGVTNDVWGSADAVPKRLWAEFTYLDNRPAIEGNFGIPVEFTLDNLAQLPSSVDYLSAVRGLWYAYFKGPTLFNLRAGTQILLGLPFAEEAGTIEEIRTDYSPTQGRILIRDKISKEHVRSYTFPSSLPIEINPATGEQYAVGDKVNAFAPLVEGVEVLDWVKDPRWFEGYLQQGAFYEVEKFHKFLVRVDSAAFNLPALLFVQTFIKRIKPTYTYPLFVVLKKIGADGSTEVSTTDSVSYSGSLFLHDGAGSQYNSNTSTLGVATMFDEPDPSGGGWQSKLDTDHLPATGAPVHPTRQTTIWAVDHTYMAPEDYILATCCDIYPALAFPVLDSVFSLDAEIYNSGAIVFEDSWVTFVPETPGITLPGSPHTVVSGMTITDVNVRITGDNGQSVSNTYTLIVKKNGSTALSTVIDSSAAVWSGDTSIHVTTSISVAPGDTLDVLLEANNSNLRNPLWKSLMVRLGISTAWQIDVQLPAATYCAHRVL